MNSKLDKWTLTLLRAVLGIIFMYHGYMKLFAPGGFVSTVDLMAKIGILLPKASALIVAIAEFFGGILLIAGAATAWVSALLLFEMSAAFFTVHVRNGLLVSKGGYEFVLLILAGLLIILVNGPGKLALGKKLFKSRHWH